MHQQPAFLCKSSVILLENEKSELPWSCAGLFLILRLYVAGKSGMLELVDNFLQFGKGKEKRLSLAKMFSKKDVLQASIPEALTQEASCDEDCQLDTFKGWDGHSIDGSPSLGKGQATGRVDVPVDATATSFGYVDVAPLHRSPQSVVLVNLGSHVEKNEKPIFVKGVEGKTKVRRVRDTTQIWELLDEGIDMWVAVNGKRVEKDATMAQIGIQDQDAHKMGRRGCGRQKTDASGVVTRSIMTLFPLVRSLVQRVELHKECLPRTQHIDGKDARTRFLVNMYLRWFRRGSP